MSPHLPALCKATLLSCLLAAIGGSALAASETLPEVVERVLLQQPSVRSAQALLNAAQSQVTQVRSDFLPTASLGYRNGKSRDETQGVPFDRTVRRSDASLRWNIFNGGTDTYRLLAIRLGRDAAEMDLDEALERVAAEISENYADVVRLRQTIDSLDGTIARQERLKQLVADRVNAGRIPPAELDLAGARLIQSRTLRGQLRTQLSTAEYRYQLLTGSAPEQLVLPAITSSAQDSGAKELIERLHERNPRLRAALQRVSARKADIGAARGSFMPSVDLEFTQRLSNKTDPIPVTDSEYGNLLRVNLDIPLGGKNIARHNEAIERHEAALADAEQLSQDLSREITDTYGQLEEMAKIESFLEQRIRSAQRVAAAYELHFEAGRRTLNDVSIAQDDLFDAQRNLIENSTKQTVLKAKVLSMAGELRGALRTRYHPAPIAADLLGTHATMPTTPPLTAPSAATAGEGASAPQQTDIKQAIGEVEGAVEQWRSAWSEKNFERYRSHYSANFQPPNAVSTARWETERRQRIAQAVSPSIRIEALKSEFQDKNRVITRFLQHYKAGSFSDTVHKQLDWVRLNGQWRIASETSRPVAVTHAWPAP